MVVFDVCINPNPAETTRAKDAMHAKKYTYEEYGTHHQGDMFFVQLFPYLSALARIAPLREIQLLFLG